jgi:hypothetical protein
MPVAVMLPQVVLRPEVPDNVEEVEVVRPGVDTLGPGTVTIGLIPKLWISVAPSGIPSLPDEDPAAIADVAAVPEDEMSEVVALHVPGMVEADVPRLPEAVPLKPPPS